MTMNKQATQDYVPHFPTLAHAARYLAELTQNYDFPQVIATSEGGDPAQTSADEHLAQLAASDIVFFTDDDNNGIPF